MCRHRRHRRCCCWCCWCCCWCTGKSLKRHHFTLCETAWEKVRDLVLSNFRPATVQHKLWIIYIFRAELFPTHTPSHTHTEFSIWLPALPLSSAIRVFCVKTAGEESFIITSWSPMGSPPHISSWCFFTHTLTIFSRLVVAKKTSEERNNKSNAGEFWLTLALMWQNSQIRRGPCVMVRIPVHAGPTADTDQRPFRSRDCHGGLRLGRFN